MRSIGFGHEDHRGEVSSSRHGVTGARHQHDASLVLTLTVWLKSCLSGFRTAKSPPVSPLDSSEGSQGRGVGASVHGGVCATPSVREIRVSHPFVPLDWYMLTDAHFILRVRIECYICFFAQVVSVLAVGRAL